MSEHEEYEARMIEAAAAVAAYDAARARRALALHRAIEVGTYTDVSERTGMVRSGIHAIVGRYRRLHSDTTALAA